MNPHPSATCALCGGTFPVEAIFGHLRAVHDFDEEPATWPDGEWVVIDQTLEPGDFEDSA
jgi:hypothetical protein